ncbi:hypothetical protein JMJ77_0006550 [Colletotrichum scovillei]|uniref:Uncharacterized protein n=1 Tax=Colletotrichum scovillei TaxID=1209932 RepID=A0A9P7RJF7_9PEZI|nr:hypothetical protein JMJ77_0006550 [Colletotrichum scovillei]KAG7077824.1 hypothetical protein JMJ76_0015066 [Colletotrichum scovillei]KAG7084885.1 hypothetical protein JMJ78_0010315 [Colletotrichum scovillei]
MALGVDYSITVVSISLPTRRRLSNWIDGVPSSTIFFGHELPTFRPHNEDLPRRSKPIIQAQTHSRIQLGLILSCLLIAPVHAAS